MAVTATTPSGDGEMVTATATVMAMENAYGGNTGNRRWMAGHLRAARREHRPRGPRRELDASAAVGPRREEGACQPNLAAGERR